MTKISLENIETPALPLLLKDHLELIGFIKND